jgi:hypothetical protein
VEASRLTPEFDERTVELTEEVLELLSLPRWPPWRGPRDPELRKNLGRLHMALADARRLAAEGALDTAGQRELLARIDKLEPASLNADSAGELLEAVDQQLIAAGDQTLLCSLLEAEYQRDEGEETRLVVTWSDMYDQKPIAASRTFRAGKTVDAADLEEAQNKLAALYRTRAMAYGLSRARTMTKAKHLLLVPPVLIPVLVAVVVLADRVSKGVTWREGALAAVAGALGATLSSGYALRDQLPRIGQLRAFGYLFAAQAPLGAAAGLFLWLVVASGLLSVAHSDDSLVRAAVAFVAGFSEPFVLSTVARIAGTEKKPPVGSCLEGDGEAVRRRARAGGDGDAPAGASR